MSAELLPCPFCGARLEFKRGSQHDASMDFYEHPNNDCALANVDLGDTITVGDYPEAIAAWNSRATAGASQASALGSANDAIVLALARCAIANSPNDAVLQQLRRLTKASSGRERERLQALLDWHDNGRTPPAETVVLATPAAQDGGQGEREAFEGWYSDGGKDMRAITRSRDGYLLSQAQSAWIAWQASWQAARSAPRPVLTDEQAEWVCKAQKLMRSLAPLSGWHELANNGDKLFAARESAPFPVLTEEAIYEAIEAGEHSFHCRTRPANSPDWIPEDDHDYHVARAVERAVREGGGNG